MMKDSSPGVQRRAIPRGAQFCSIYLQIHINKCCRIVQLLKSRQYGEEAMQKMRDHCREGGIISKMQPEAYWICEKKWRKRSIFRFIPHKYYLLAVSSKKNKKKPGNNPNASVIALSQCWHSVSFCCTLCLWWRAVSLFVLHTEWNPFPAEKCYNSPFLLV